jgi:hypothetical protein
MLLHKNEAVDVFVIGYNLFSPNCDILWLENFLTEKKEERRKEVSFVPMCYI